MSSSFISETTESYLVPWIIATPQILLGMFVIYGIKNRYVTLQVINFKWPTNKQICISIALVGFNLIFIYSYAVFVMKFGMHVLMPPAVPADILGVGYIRYVNLITICIFVPLIEEIFFRGFFFNALMGKFNLFYAMIFSSMIFAIMHGAIGLLVPVFFSSMMISFLYYKNKTIWTPVITHALQNLLVVIVASTA
tara:strand:- start:568 stop:1152 length:585 start_codon:yes stop_codon:yes gene_type:complete